MTQGLMCNAEMVKAVGFVIVAGGFFGTVAYTLKLLLGGQSQ